MNVTDLVPSASSICPNLSTYTCTRATAVANYNC